MKTETIVGLFILGAVCILLYLSLSIGSFRFDRDRFHFYKAYFDDTGGLEEKNPVKIAGVDVGWVSELRLPADGGKAMVTFRVKKDHKLAKNAYAMVRQEGFFGPKYLELDPGDSSTGFLPPGSALGAPAQTPASWGELITKFSDVATHFNAVAASLQNVISTREGEENLKLALNGFARASDRIANFSEILERTLARNEQNVNDSLDDMRQTIRNLRESVPQLTSDAHQVAQDLHAAVPSFNDLSKKAGSAFESFESTSDEARPGLRHASGVMEKINSGTGTVGKLINEDEVYVDFKKTLRNFKDYSSKFHALDVLVDMHSESMTHDWTSKGYFELKLRPTDDYFYVVQLVASENGTIKYEQIHFERLDKYGNEVLPPAIQDLYRYPDTKNITTRRKNDILFGLQFGKRFDRLALRAGLFENSFGMGVDYYVPLNSDKIHWITTLEAFDLKGFNRINDNRPHVKWLNKVYFMRNLYTTFGVDDVYSKGSQNFFIGGGIRFGDKDLKYVLPSLPISSLKS